MRNKRGLAVRAAAAGLLTLAGVAVATSGASAAVPHNVSKSCSHPGKNATCTVEADIAYPAGLSFTITAAPNQTVVGAYSDECYPALGTYKNGISKTVSFSGITPLTLTAKQGYAHPGECIIAVDAQLNSSGKSIHISINSPAVAAPAIKSAAGGCVNDAGDSSANGTKIVLWSCNGQGQQDWTYTKGKLVHNGRCLTDPASGEPGDKLALEACSASGDDLWGHASNGEYVLTVPGGQLCLTTPAEVKGTQLTASVCADAKAQRWSLP